MRWTASKSVPQSRRFAKWSSGRVDLRVPAEALNAFKRPETRKKGVRNIGRGSLSQRTREKIDRQRVRKDEHRVSLGSCGRVQSSKGGWHRQVDKKLLKSSKKKKVRNEGLEREKKTGKHSVGQKREDDAAAPNKKKKMSLISHAKRRGTRQSLFLRGGDGEDKRRLEGEEMGVQKKLKKSQKRERGGSGGGRRKESYRQAEQDEQKRGGKTAF